LRASCGPILQLSCPYHGKNLVDPLALKFALRGAPQIKKCHLGTIHRRPARQVAQGVKHSTEELPASTGHPVTRLRPRDGHNTVDRRGLPQTSPKCDSPSCVSTCSWTVARGWANAFDYT